MKPLAFLLSGSFVLCCMLKTLSTHVFLIRDDARLQTSLAHDVFSESSSGCGRRTRNATIMQRERDALQNKFVPADRNCISYAFLSSLYFSVFVQPFLLASSSSTRESSDGDYGVVSSCVLHSRLLAQTRCVFDLFACMLSLHKIFEVGL